MALTPVPSPTIPARITLARGSPDGTRIVFFSRRASAGGDAFIMSADGNGVRRITFGSGAEAVNAWLPDGRLVVAVSPPGREGAPDWYLMSQDGKQLAPVPQLADAMEPIAWWWPPSPSA